MIIKQDPLPGTALDAGSYVYLTDSIGPPAGGTGFSILPGANQAGPHRTTIHSDTDAALPYSGRLLACLATAARR